jgi:hypothetical protein
MWRVRVFRRKMPNAAHHITSRSPAPNLTTFTSATPRSGVRSQEAGPIPADPPYERHQCRQTPLQLPILEPRAVNGKPWPSPHRARVQDRATEPLATGTGSHCRAITKKSIYDKGQGINSLPKTVIVARAATPNVPPMVQRV